LSGQVRDKTTSAPRVKGEKLTSAATSANTVIPALSGIPYNCVGSCLTCVFTDNAGSISAMLFAFIQTHGSAQPFLRHSRRREGNRSLLVGEG
jgi:hypothetical protein